MPWPNPSPIVSEKKRSLRLEEAANRRVGLVLRELARGRAVALLDRTGEQRPHRERMSRGERLEDADELLERRELSDRDRRADAEAVRGARPPVVSHVEERF